MKKIETLVVEVRESDGGTTVRASLVRKERATPIYEVTRTGELARARAIDALLAGAEIIADTNTGGHYRLARSSKRRIEVSLGLRIMEVRS